MGAVAAIMLLVGGDAALTGLQSLTIIAALPFALVMVGMAVSLAKDVRSDPLVLRRSVAVEAVEQAVVEGVTRHGEDFVLVVEPAPRTPPPAPPPSRRRSGVLQTAIGTCATSARRCPRPLRRYPLATDESCRSASS